MGQKCTFFSTSPSWLSEPLKYNENNHTIYLLISKQIRRINMQLISKTCKRTYLEAASTQGASKSDSNDLAKLMTNLSTHKDNPTLISNEYPISISRHPKLVHNSGIPVNQNLEKRQKLLKPVSLQHLNEQIVNDQVESGIPVNLESPLSVHLLNPLRDNLFNAIRKDYSSADFGYQIAKSSAGELDKHSYQILQEKESLSLIHNSGIPVVNQSTNFPHPMEIATEVIQDHYQEDLSIYTESSSNRDNAQVKDYSRVGLVGYQIAKSSAGEPDKHSYQFLKEKESLSLIHNSGIPVANQSTNFPHPMEIATEVIQNHQEDLSIYTDSSSNRDNSQVKDYSRVELVGYQIAKPSAGDPDKHSSQFSKEKESLSLIHNSGIPVANQLTNFPHPMETAKEVKQDHYQEGLSIYTELNRDHTQAKAMLSANQKKNSKYKKL